MYWTLYMYFATSCNQYWWYIKSQDRWLGASTCRTAKKGVLPHEIEENTKIFTWHEELHVEYSVCFINPNTIEIEEPPVTAIETIHSCSRDNVIHQVRHRLRIYCNLFRHPG
jgi:hypothetical protein